MLILVPALLLLTRLLASSIESLVSSTQISARSKVSKQMANELLAIIYHKPRIGFLMAGENGPLCSGQYLYKTVGADINGRNGELHLTNTFHVFKVDHFQGRMPVPIFKVQYEGHYTSSMSLDNAKISVDSLLPEDLLSCQECSGA